MMEIDADKLLMGRKDRPRTLVSQSEILDHEVVQTDREVIEYDGKKLVAEKRIIKETRVIVTVREMGEYEATLQEFIDDAKE